MAGWRRRRSCAPWSFRWAAERAEAAHDVAAAWPGRAGGNGSATSRRRFRPVLRLTVLWSPTVEGRASGRKVTNCSPCPSSAGRHRSGQWVGEVCGGHRVLAGRRGIPFLFATKANRGSRQRGQSECQGNVAGRDGGGAQGHGGLQEGPALVGRGRGAAVGVACILLAAHRAVQCQCVHRRLPWRHRWRSGSCVTSSRSTTMAPRRRQPRRSSWPSRRFHDRSGGWRSAGSAAVRTRRGRLQIKPNGASVLVWGTGPDGPRRSGPGRGHSTRHEPITTNSRCSNHLLPGSPRDGPRCWGVLVSGRIGRRSPGCG